MPLFEGITSISLINEKHTTIIFDFGTKTTKVGFAGETCPRAITPTEVTEDETGQLVPVFQDNDPEVLRRRLAAFIHKLFVRFLLVNPKDRRVVVLENLLSNNLYKDTIAKVLFLHLEVPSVAFVPSHLVSLMCLGVNTGLVLDVGHSEVTLIPVYEGVPILNAWGALPLGGKAVLDSLKGMLQERGTMMGVGGQERSLSEEDCSELTVELLEEIMLGCCFVSTPERSERLQRNRQDRSNEPPPPPPEVLYPFSGSKNLRIPGSVREAAAEVLFECDADQQSLPHLLLERLTRCPVDTRRPLAANLVIMGGTAMIMGFKHRLLQELRSLAATAPYSERMAPPEFRVHRLPVKENCAAWTGGCILGSSESCVVIHSITREHFMQLNDSRSVLPDWTSAAHNVREGDACADM